MFFHLLSKLHAAAENNTTLIAAVAATAIATIVGTTAVLKKKKSKSSKKQLRKLKRKMLWESVKNIFSFKKKKKAANWVGSSNSDWKSGVGLILMLVGGGIALLGLLANIWVVLVGVAIFVGGMILMISDAAGKY